MSQFEESVERSIEGAPACPAAISVTRFVALYGREGRSNFVYDPAVRELVVRPERRHVIERALRRSAYMIALRLYLRLPGLYLRQLVVEFRILHIKAHYYLLRLMS